MAEPTGRQHLLSYALAATSNEVTWERAEKLADAHEAEYRDQVLAEAAEIASTVIGPLWHLDTLHEIHSRILAARTTPDAR